MMGQAKQINFTPPPVTRTPNTTPPVNPLYGGKIDPNARMPQTPDPALQARKQTMIGTAATPHGQALWDLLGIPAPNRNTNPFTGQPMAPTPGMGAPLQPPTPPGPQWPYQPAQPVVGQPPAPVVGPPRGFQPSPRSDMNWIQAPGSPSDIQPGIRSLLSILLGGRF